MPWVDGDDPEWIKLFNQYSPVKKTVIEEDFIQKKRYEDIGLLRYWFRCVEKNAPWVNKVFFITNGQKPEWLNLNCERLVWIKHADYIPREYLPVFSANPIETNLHRIKELSEHFIYFNDDVFIVNNVKDSFYFNKEGLPCDYAILNRIHPMSFGHIVLNNVSEINMRFDKDEVLSKNKSKWFNLIYGKGLIMNIFFNQYPGFSGFFATHTSQAFLKSTFGDVWKACGQILCETSASRFRNVNDVSGWLFRYWQLVTGKFHPVSPRGRKLFGDKVNLKELKKCFSDPAIKEVCINDGENHEEIIKLFEKKYPEKSMFEL